MRAYLIEDTLYYDLPAAFLEPRETARWLGVTLGTLYSTVSRGKLVRKRWRVVPMSVSGNDFDEEEKPVRGSGRELRIIEKGAKDEA